MPWAIWLQGGSVARVCLVVSAYLSHVSNCDRPGTSSLYGLFTENGPIQVVPGKESLEQNQYAWSDLIDYIWVDQPVYVTV